MDSLLFGGLTTRMVATSKRDGHEKSLFSGGIPDEEAVNAIATFSSSTTH
jgi:hypothetical protein